MALLPASPRGGALILVMVILVALALLGAGALMLSQQEAATVSRTVEYNALLACADAAEKKLWAEYAHYGGNVPAIRPTVVPSTAGDVKLSIAHYDADSAVVAVTFDERSFRQLDRNSMSGGLGQLDQSNTFRSELGGRPYLVVAHCTDARSRQYEVELLVRFGI